MENDDPNLIDCPNCGAQVSLTWSRCPECGQSFYPDEDPDDAGNPWKTGGLAAGLGWLARSLITFLVIGGLLGAFIGLTLGLSWLGMMLGGILLFAMGWGAWSWLRRRHS
jgi:hypothetical protein